MTKLQLHGVPSACASDGQTRPLERKDAGLLAYLAIHGKASRARLAALLWPEAEAALARTNLRQRLMRIRRQFPDLIVEDGAELALSPAVDRDGELDPLRPLRPLLEDCEYPDCPEFAAWLDARREGEQRAAGARRAGAIRTALDAGELDTALATATTFADQDPESEEAWRLLMEVYFLRADIGLALNAFDRCREMLRQTFGTRPAAETEKLGRQIQAAARAESEPVKARLPLAVMRPPRLVGREPELQRLSAALAGRRSMVIAAASGGGKSRLIDELARRPSPHLAAVDRPTGSSPWLHRLPTRQDDADLAYGAARRWLGTCLPQAAGIDDDTRALCHALLQTDSAERIRIDSAYDRGRLERAIVRAVCTGVQAGGGSAIAIDDVQFADADSRGVLAGLLSPHDDTPAPVGGPPMLPVVIAVRAGADPGLDRWLDELAASHLVDRIDLPPLSPAESVDLLRSLDLPALSADVERLLAEQSAGRPSIMLEAVKTAWPGDAAQFETRATASAVLSLAQTVSQRYAALHAVTRRVLAVLAVSGDEMDVDLLADAVGGDRAALDAALAEGESVGVLAAAGIVHDSLRDALLDELPAEQLGWAHAALAAALMRRPRADPRRIARHLRAAGNPAAALPYLVRAARSALLATEAVQLWQEVAALHEARGDAEAAFDAWFDAWRLLRLLPDDTEGEHRAAAALARCATSPAAAFLAQVCAAEQLLTANRFDEALSRLQGLSPPWDRPLAPGDSRHLSRAAPLMASVYHRAGHSGDALGPLENLAACIDRSDPAAVAATEAALGSIVLGAGMPARAVRHFNGAVDAARLGHDRSAEYRTRGTMTSALLRCGRFDDAWQCSAEAGRLAVGLGFEPGSRNEAELGAISLYLGRFSESLDLLQVAKGYFERRGLSSYTMIELIQGGLYLHLGRPELAQQVLASIVEDQLYPALRFAWHMQRAVTAMAAGIDPAPHWQGCDRTRALSLGVELLREKIWRSADAPPAHAIAQARSVAQEAERLHHWHLVRSALTACAAAHLRAGDPASALAASQEALASCPHCDLWTSWHVDTWWVMHRALAAVGRAQAAAESLRRAAAWIDVTAQAHVPPAFRDSFTQRVALNRTVREAARTALSALPH